MEKLNQNQDPGDTQKHEDTTKNDVFTTLGATKYINGDTVKNFLKKYSKDGRLKIKVVEMIQYCPEEERSELVKIALEDKNLQIRRETLEMIQYCPEEERSELVKIGLRIYESHAKNQDKPDSSPIQVLVTMIQYCPEKERSELVKIALKDGDAGFRRQAVTMIQCCPEEERSELVKIALKDKDVSVKIKAVEMIQYCPEEERSELVKIALEDENVGVKVAVIGIAQNYIEESEKQILTALIDSIIGAGNSFRGKESKEIQGIYSQYIKTINPHTITLLLEPKIILGMSKEQRSKAIVKVLGLQDGSVNKQAVEIIQYCPEEERSELVKIGFNIFSSYAKETYMRSNFPIRRLATMIQYCPEEERSELAKKFKDTIQKTNKEETIKIEDVLMIQFYPEEERSELVKTMLQNTNLEIKKQAVEIIQYCPEEERSELVKIALKDKNVSVKIKAVEMIQYCPEEERSELVKIALKDKDLQIRRKTLEMIQRCPEEGQTDLKRMIGDKDIVPISPHDRKKQKVSIEQFFLWEKAYGHDREKEGLDYIPMEKITNNKHEKRYFNENDIFTTNVTIEESTDCTFIERDKKNIRHVAEILQQTKKITEAMKKLGISLRHPYENSFCLKFDKLENGSINYNQCPKVYLTNWDNTHKTNHLDR